MGLLYDHAEPVFFFTDESSLNKCQLCLPIVQKGSTFFQQSSRWAKKDTLHAKCQNNVPLCQNNVPLCQKCNAMTKYYIAMPGYSTATPIVPHQCWTPHHCNYRRKPFFWNNWNFNYFSLMWLSVSHTNIIEINWFKFFQYIF